MLHLKITKSVFNYMVEDLSRQHEYAYERVGFLFINKGSLTDNDSLLLATDYIPVADENYIEDQEVGARINSSAIREILQQIYDKGQGVLHVHLHDFDGIPTFSKVDIENLRLLIPSFQNISPQTFNGALLIQNSLLNSIIWLPEEGRFERVDRITIVGFPHKFFGRY